MYYFCTLRRERVLSLRNLAYFQTPTAAFQPSGNTHTQPACTALSVCVIIYNLGKAKHNQNRRGGWGWKTRFEYPDDTHITFQTVSSSRVRVFLLLWKRFDCLAAPFISHFNNSCLCGFVLSLWIWGKQLTMLHHAERCSDFHGVELLFPHVSTCLCNKQKQVVLFTPWAKAFFYLSIPWFHRWV